MCLMGKVRSMPHLRLFRFLRVKDGTILEFRVFGIPYYSLVVVLWAFAGPLSLVPRQTIIVTEQSLSIYIFKSRFYCSCSRNWEDFVLFREQVK